MSSLHNSLNENLIFNVYKKIGLITLVTIAIILLVGFIEPRFYSKINQLNILRNMAFLLLVAYGQMLVMIVGGFDLSVGAVAAFGSIVGATVMSNFGGTECGYESMCLTPITVGFLASLIAGLFVGLINGLIVAIGRVSAFMVTLAMMMVVEGLIIYWTNGTPVYGLPDFFTKQLGRGIWFGAPLIFWVSILLGIMLWFLQNKMTYGGYIYAVGGNISSARNTGLPVIKVMISAYMLSGMFAALSGIFMAARIGSGQASIGGSLMIESIAAAVIGGVSLRGGIGRVEKVIVGCLLLAVVQNALNLLRVDSKMQSMAMGLVLLIAVALDQLNIRRNNNA